jgi:hypothetical protein
MTIADKKKSIVYGLYKIGKAGGSTVKLSLLRAVSLRNYPADCLVVALLIKDYLTFPPRTGHP